MAIITIDGVDLPAPSSMSIPMSDLDSPDTTRNELGILQRDRIRQGVHKVELAWNVITSSQVNTILSAIEPAKFSVTFPTTFGTVTKDMYCGDRKLDVVLYKNGDNPYWSLSFNLIEY